MTGEQPIRYRLSRRDPLWLKRVRQLGWLAPAALAAGAAARSAPPRGYVLAAIVGVLWVGSLLLSRASVEVTPHDISVPFTPRIPWSSVAHVKRPGRFDEQVTVALRDGREKAILLPPEMAEDVAAIGNVPLSG